MYVLCAEALSSQVTALESELEVATGREQTLRDTVIPQLQSEREKAQVLHCTSYVSLICNLYVISMRISVVVIVFAFAPAVTWHSAHEKCVRAHFLSGNTSLSITGIDTHVCCCAL